MLFFFINFWFDSLVGSGGRGEICIGKGGRERVKWFFFLVIFNCGGVGCLMVWIESGGEIIMGFFFGLVWFLVYICVFFFYWLVFGFWFDGLVGGFWFLVPGWKGERD